MGVFNVEMFMTMFEQCYMHLSFTHHLLMKVVHAVVLSPIVTIAVSLPLC